MRLRPPSPPNLGHKAEDTACAYLERQGLRLLARNYRCPHGEIDLVMDHDNTLVFVEVRYRKNGMYGTALESVDARKQAKIRATAEHYLQRHGAAARRACRFDIVALHAVAAGGAPVSSPGSPPAPSLNWLQDAFGI
jgi:putative endonuclease